MKYIGNKTNLLNFIEESLKSGGVELDGSFTDLFSGTTSVAEHFKKIGLSVTANDFMTYSYVFQKAFIELNEVPNFKTILDKLRLNASPFPEEQVIDYLNKLSPIEGYFFNNYGDGGSESRMYFTKENACLIDAIREEIEKWKMLEYISQSEYYYLLAVLIDAADHVANMSGTYGAFLKIWRSVALKKIRLKSRPVYNNFKSNYVYQGTAEDLITKISGDILYLDPPYNSRQYAPNFHVLESLAVWDKQNLAGKTGLRNYDNQKSDFSSKTKAISALENVIHWANFKYIALSYNNEGIIPHEKILQILGNKGELQVFTTQYRRFRTESNHAKRQYKDVDDKTSEYLFLVKTNVKTESFT
jgi:adenine-specific DNA-methyltransferase